ncbi:hypothetical protein [uncultured Veillonella sp.]|uniref:hypothetical protein n=1 Tax=uncultured Veillonella sp. TaxID=159268 RepID=UPI002611D349|nr:hypothetical protein [uncultured Veillonella sp.]
MIKRLYLPYESARAYRDRGMAKWMGFFISDHLSALQESAITVEFAEDVSVDEILEWLSQIYIQQLIMTYYVKSKKGIQEIKGRILELTLDHMILQVPTDTATPTYERIEIIHIIKLSKGGDDDAF